MSEASGFYKGVNIEQDNRYTDKEKKLLKQMKFENALNTKIDLGRVNLDVIKPWITAKLNAILGMEDDIVAEFVFTQLEEKNLNPKIMQINLTGFLNARRAREFMGELWTLLLEAQSSSDGIPTSLINKKMEELKASQSGSRRDVPMAKATENDWRNRYDSLVGGRYGKAAPNYASEPGAGDEINREPESPSNRRWRRERTPDSLPIPRRKRGGDDEPDKRQNRNKDRNRDRDRDRERDRERDRDKDRARDHEKNRSDYRSQRYRDRSKSRERKSRRSRSSSPPVRRRFAEERRSPRYSDNSEDECSSPPVKSETKKRKRRDSDSSVDKRSSPPSKSETKKSKHREADSSPDERRKSKKHKKSKHKKDRD